MKKGKKYFEMKVLFDTLTLEDLESLYVLIGLTKDYDKEVRDALNSAYVRKYEERVNSGDYEGRNEYDNLTAIHNFSLTNIMNIFDLMTQTELNELCKLVCKSYGTILEKDKAGEDPIENEIRPELEMFIKKYNRRKAAKKMFEKLDRNDQVMLSMAMDLSCGFDIGDEKAVLSRILSNPTPKFNKGGKLTNDELIFIYNITSSASAVLSLEMYEELEYQRSLMYDFEDRLSAEIKDREEGRGAKVLSPYSVKKV